MTMLIGAEGPNAPTRPGGGLQGRMRKVASWLPRVRAGRAPRWLPHDLSDRELADLNLRRLDLEIPDPRAPRLF